jgi:murein DD-endopeptidase MepM/ murein hydrolase activator NlpD
MMLTFTARPRFLWFRTFLVLLILAGCRMNSRPPLETAQITPTSITRETILQPEVEQPASPAPTAVIGLEQKPAEMLPEAISEVTLAADPLRFAFPTPAKGPVSAWRPPLYPTPWAPTPFDHFYFARPIGADEVNAPSQFYRYGGEFFDNVVHTGIDIPASKGTPVLAAGSGKIIWAGYGIYRGGYDVTDPYGKAVVIRHDFGYQGLTLYTVYGHLDEIEVAEGQHVETGETIGLVGETGRVTGPHLHFEVRVGENDFFRTRNPELWLSPPEGWGVLAGQIMDTGGRLVTKQNVIVTSLQNNQNWFSRSYGPNSVNSDPYYQENMTVGDLPAGRYEIRIAYAGISFRQEIEIFPGLVSYFRFYGRAGFELGLPPTPGVDFTPGAESAPWGESTSLSP